ncbi:MAG TPA: HYR domain-containing protein [Gaiellaceae bacterium]|nr:HYR domain-containing protein [Gaiellaceae bacterium]
MLFTFAGLAVVLVGGAVVASGVKGPNGVTADPNRPPDHGEYWTSPVTITFSGSEPGDTCDPAQVQYSGQNISSTCTKAADPSVTYSDTFGTSDFPYDDVPPIVHVPSGITEEATSAQGAVVVFDGQVTAEGGPDPTCTPKDSGDVFPIDTTPVTCTSTDAAGLSDSASFDVTVRDTTEPQFGAAPDVTREGNVLGGYQGDAYTPPTATDAVGGGIPVDCSPGPGAKFDLGSTDVTCRATDASDNTATKTFTVTVTDTTRPNFLLAPQDVTVQAANANTGTPATHGCIQQFLDTPTAHDEVGGNRPVTNDALLRRRFPVGDTTVTFTASDGQGNDAHATAVVSVRIGPQGQCTIDPRAPGNVRKATAREDNKLVVLRWQNPGAQDFWRVEIERTRTDGLGGTRTFKTKREVLRDDEVRNGVEYRYVIYSVDEAGNRPNGVERRATPHRLLLLRPRDEVVLRSPPLFDWVNKARARYYNFQIHRMVNGELRKVLSRWPTVSSFKLRSPWRFEGRRYRFVPGRYFWYVWPGFGPRSAANYGELMGANSFRVKRR